jgi:hypothetical protein
MRAQPIALKTIELSAMEGSFAMYKLPGSTHRMAFCVVMSSFAGATAARPGLPGIVAGAAKAGSIPAIAAVQSAIITSNGITHLIPCGEVT